MSLKKPVHVPVLLREVCESCLTHETRTVFDGTIGLGGHAEGILEQFDGLDKYIGCDLDETHLLFSKKRLEKWCEKTVFVNKNFSEIKEVIQELGIVRPLVILLDLGICSLHVDNPERGFSFNETGPLHMAFDQKNNAKCEKLINRGTEAELKTILKQYGEEPNALKISRKIIEARTHKKIETTGDLRKVVEQAVHPKDQKKTLVRVFQAFRIATNEELEHLEKALHDAFEVMMPGDRIGVIAYHSLEDRMVKQFFLQKSKPVTIETDRSLHAEIAPAQARLVVRKAIVPSPEEISKNPRSRSAKFRVLEKI